VAEADNVRKVVAIGLAGLALAACSTAHRAQTAAQGAADRARTAASQTAHKASQTAEVATHPQADAVAMDKPEKEGVRGAVQQPFEDINLIRHQIPPVLLDAEDSPYRTPRPTSCNEITGEVLALNDALGDDFDANEPDNASVDEKHGRQAGEAMVLALRDTEADFIPFRSWVRRLSGAQKADDQVRAAVYSGRVRRSYLKGLGLALGCRYPAAPKGVQPLASSRRR
jgi:hypothetical protein